MVGKICGEMQDKHDEQGPHDKEKSGKGDHSTKGQGKGTGKREEVSRFQLRLAVGPKKRKGKSWAKSAGEKRRRFMVFCFENFSKLFYLKGVKHYKRQPLNHKTNATA